MHTIRECMVATHGISCYETTTRIHMYEWLAILAVERMVEWAFCDLLQTTPTDVLRCLDGVAFT